MIERKCVLVLDVQAAMFELPRPLHDGAALLETIGHLLDSARTVQSVIAYAQHCGVDGSRFRRGGDGWRVHPAVAPRPGDFLFEKTHCDAFQNGALLEMLERSAIRELVVCGLVTEGCVDTTVRRAFGLGLNTQLASDGHSTTDGPVLSAELTKRHHNEVLKAFAQVTQAKDIEFGRMA
jgi:nicotinamidase-related amidase